MSTERDNPVGTHGGHRWTRQKRRRPRSRRQAEAEADDNLEREGRMLLVYTGDCDPFDARETIKELREGRTP